jgi:hypothetical protein
MDRRNFLNGLAGTALGLLQPGCSQETLLDASLTIDNDDAGRLIPRDFIGLSYESSVGNETHGMLDERCAVHRQYRGAPCPPSLQPYPVLPIARSVTGSPRACCRRAAYAPCETPLRAHGSLGRKKAAAHFISRDAYSRVGDEQDGRCSKPPVAAPSTMTGAPSDGHREGLSCGSELGRQVTVDLEADADLDKGRGRPRDGRFLFILSHRYSP